MTRRRDARAEDDEALRLLADVLRARVHARGEDLVLAPREGHAGGSRGEPADDRRLGGVPRRRRASAWSTTPSTSSTPSATTLTTRSRCVRAAADAGAENVTLCDTNGRRCRRTSPRPPTRVCGRARRSRAVGIHTHDDAGCGVANALVAVEAGARLVQGTMNGYGERCGNANLISIIPALELKLGDEYDRARPAAAAHRDRPPGGRALQRHARTRTSRTWGERVRAQGRDARGRGQPDARTFEHIDPAEVGGPPRVLVSELSGKGTVAGARPTWTTRPPRAWSTG